MTKRTIRSLTEDDLRRTFDSGSLSRGKPYARAGRVTVVDLDDDGRHAEADVRGSGMQVYSTTVEVRESRTGESRIIADCSCPVGFGCKHAVAVIVAIRDSITPYEEPNERKYVPVAAHESWARPAPRLVEPQWKQALGPLARAGEESATDEWALKLELTGAGRYGIRFLTARPMKRGVKGGWIKTGASWSDVDTHVISRRGGPTAEALHELHVAHRQSHYGYGRSSGELDLSSLSVEAWGALDRAMDAGITLLGPGKAAVEIDSAPVAVGLQVVDDGSDGLQIGATLSDESLTEDWSHGRSLVIGQPAHGMASWDAELPTRVRLVRFEHVISDTLGTLLSNRRSIDVPPADADEFVRDYLPRISRAVGQVTVDPHIAVPDIAPPRLSVTIAHVGLGVTMQWGFAYDIDGATERVAWAPGRESFRDAAAERELVATFVPPEVGLDLTATDRAGRTALVPVLEVDGYQAVVVSEVLAPALAALGVDVHVVGTRPDYRLSEAAPMVHVALDDGQRDWYDLAVTVTIDGEQVEFEPLFAALAAGETHLVLPSGTYLLIDRPELLRLRELIDEARQLTDRRSGHLRVNRFHVGLWDELVSLGVVDRQSASWQQSVGALFEIDEIPALDLPNGLKAELRPYQHDGYAWLCFLVDHGLGGILADDMGLGKTVQTLAMIVRQAERGSGPFLVVAPTSVVGNWAREAARFAPDLTVATITQSRARRGAELTEAVEGADIVVTSYALFRIEYDAYAEQSWAGLVLDEAQFVKNHQGKTYQCARRLEAPFKLAITGTPLENSLMDLWSMLSIAAPGLYPDPRRFAEHYQKPIESGSGQEQLALLQRRIRPLMRRRTKDEVATDLPPKTEQVLEVALSPRHAKIYETHLQRERQKVLGLLADDADGNRFEVLRSLTKLRQLSLDPALIDEEHDEVGSAKVDVLLEHLQEVTAEGHRALVFSQFTGFLKRVRTSLDEAGIPYAYLDGRTRRRTEAVESFTTGDKTVFLISLKAGGVGLNLVEADYCYVLDPWWNPAAEAQAVDRAHRIGQTRPVMVYRLVSTDTIEEKVMALKARKAALFDAVIDEGTALSGALTPDDTRGLLNA